MRKDFPKTGAFLKGFACNYSICNYGGPNVTSVSIKTDNSDMLPQPEWIFDANEETKSHH
jgi:hypothetical protein